MVSVLSIGVSVLICVCDVVVYSVLLSCSFVLMLCVW